ncbi:MAG: hypothetical protein ABR964_13005 [Tepidisphaeraceae bacterium]|jgi:hypothetical protein
MSTSPATIAPGSLDAAKPDRAGRHLLLLLLAAAATRLAWLWLMPRQIVSVDLKDWLIVAGQLYVGRNPYDTGVLNWPPFWLESLYGLMRLSDRFHLSFYLCVRCFLILGDLGLLVAVYGLLRLLDRQAPYFQLLLWGYCLNPLLTLLTVQHANFDAYAMIWVVLFLCMLVRFRRGGQQVDWILACLFLGMGIFTKTFPLLLWPMLAPGSARISRPARLLGGGLLLGPTALSLAPLYILARSEISQYVLGYRGMGDTFGLVSLLRLAAVPYDVAMYARVFSLSLLGGTAALALLLRRRDFKHDADLVLLSSVLLLCVFTLGTGYGSQYWFWVVPLLLICYRHYPILRHVLWACMVVTIASNLVEYGVEGWLGGFLVGWTHWPWVSSLNYELQFSHIAVPALHLPMTLVACLTLFALANVLVRQYRLGARR